MSSTSQSALSFEDSMENISEFLKEKVIDPAQQEKEHILLNAEKEKSRILEEAQAEAARLIDDAKKRAEEKEAALESALRIASNKAVDTLKFSLEKEILSKSIDEPAETALSSGDIIKESLTEAVTIMTKNKENASVEIVLSDTLKHQLMDYLKKEITQQGSDTITISSDTVPSGFSVKLRDKNLVFDFSRESLVELLSQFLRPELRNYLFSQSQ